MRDILKSMERETTAAIVTSCVNSKMGGRRVDCQPTDRLAACKILKNFIKLSLPTRRALAPAMQSIARMSLVAIAFE